MRKKPNIIVIMTDDHGMWAAHCYGNSEIRTPNMDRIAARGVLFENAYTPSPVCSPARACFFTGKMPSQHGVHDYIAEHRHPEEYDWLHGNRTLPETLRHHGYQTGIVGKWHCGASWKARPEFDYWFSHLKGQYPHFGDQEFVENEQAYHAYGHQAPVLTEKALDCMGRFSGSEAPFFLFVGYVDTHSPFIDHPERLVSYYRDTATFRDIPSEKPMLPDGGWVRFGVPPDPREKREWLAQYYAAAECIDEQIGRIVDRLEELGELENTVLVYTSDHGHMNGHHGLYTKGNATVPQNFHEESIRVPFLIQWPERIKPGGRCSQPVSHCDVYRTLLDVCGAANDTQAAGPAFPGKSFLQVLTGGKPPDEGRDWFCEYGNARMIRRGRFKYIRRYAPHEWAGDELYDLQEDPREQYNLIAKQREVAAGLGRALDEWFSRYEDPLFSGRDILAQKEANPFEPWRLQRPGNTPPEGMHQDGLRGAIKIKKSNAVQQKPSSPAGMKKGGTQSKRE